MPLTVGNGLATDGLAMVCELCRVVKRKCIYVGNDMDKSQNTILSGKVGRRLHETYYRLSKFLKKIIIFFMDVEV